ncbi:uncharacterized protein LOC121651617 [Melanotaenia boesemani]|nr:uncharacterized protein LOC121651582 isoform X2 [Melanotaenia boesemani]XP_041859892.1 uncharacterized protein LOC121651617 [Melanotaenia boesemani]
MPTQKECVICHSAIGVARKTCQHCGGKQPYKDRLERQKQKITEDWKERQKKNCSINKVYDATNLLLHKWELLERHPVLLLARRTSSGFVAECLCPWPLDTEDARDALVTIKKIYESLLNVTVTTRTMETPAQTSDGPATGSSFTPPVSTPPVSIPPVSTPCAPPVSIPPVSTPPVSTSLTPPVSGLQKKRKLCRNADISECPIYQGLSVFPYKRILKQRLREGCVEVLVEWQPCSGCGAKWKNSWEPKDNILP